MSLATWLFFYLESMPLKPAETTVVVGCWLGVTLIVKWILGRMWKKNKAGEN